MPKIKIITGYVPIPNHPRNAQEYGKLGDKLAAIRSVPLRAFYGTVPDCWLFKALKAMDKTNFTHSEGDNPKKNSLAYHIVQHQKIHWMMQEAQRDHDTDTFIWMDYGIFHQPGVDIVEIEKFLQRVKKDDLAIPGCWDIRPVTDASPCWRFCGSLAVVPRQWVLPFSNLIKLSLFTHLKFTQNIPWEVNTWARVEQGNSLPIRWYKADHNETQFTNYGADNDREDAAM